MFSRNLVSSGSALASTQAVVQGSALLRNVIIARLITPADFGIAATFAMTVSLLEMVSNLDADKLLIQAEFGNQPRFQQASHLLQSIRGLASALILFVVAQPVSSLFGVPQAVDAFRAIALVPLIKGLAHTDPSRRQREMVFRPMIVVEITTSIVVTVFAVVLGFWIRDYWLMLWVLLLQVCTQAVMSHVRAERPYRWALDRRYVARILAFGWPLLVNGLLMFVIFQGDRFVIASAPALFSNNGYTLVDLGFYSAAFALSMAPASLVASVSTSLFLPRLSRLQDSPSDFQRSYAACAHAVCLAAALISIPLIVSGKWLVQLVYGPSYGPAGMLLGWLAAMWALRTIRIAPTLAAIARGDTRNAMMANVVRATALVGVLFAAANGVPLIWVAACGFWGELLATATSLIRLKRQHGLPVRLCLQPAAVSIVGMAGAAVAILTGLSSHGLFAVAVPAILMGLVLLTMHRMLSQVGRSVSTIVVPEGFAGHVP